MKIPLHYGEMIYNVLMECIVIEDVDDGVKVDEDDNPTFATNGYVINHLMDKIRKQHLNN